MFSSRSFNIGALSLLKKNKEENTVTYQESPPWLLMMFKTPCIETILYPEFSWSDRQANISGQTMDAGNHQLLLTSSPAQTYLAKPWMLEIISYYWQALQHITPFSRPLKIILYKFSAIQFIQFVSQKSRGLQFPKLFFSCFYFKMDLCYN